jgi:hypothetical protein
VLVLHAQLLQPQLLPELRDTTTCRPVNWLVAVGAAEVNSAGAGSAKVGVPTMTD